MIYIGSFASDFSRCPTFRIFSIYFGLKIAENLRKIGQGKYGENDEKPVDLGVPILKQTQMVP